MDHNEVEKIIASVPKSADGAQLYSAVAELRAQIAELRKLISELKDTKKKG